MYNIKTLNNISKVIHDYLTNDQYTISADIQDPDAILVRSANMHQMDLPKTLLAIARAGAGVNNIPIDSCTNEGIVVFNTPGANANAVKELVLAALLLSSRDIYNGIEWAKTLKNKGAEVPKLVEKGKSQFAGPELKGKKLGVIGLGAVGVMVANAAKAIGMEVVGYDPFISIKAAWGLSRAVHRAASLDALLAESDYITIHVPLLDETKNYISKETIAKMKKGIRIVNFSRGGLVNSDDIIEAIEDGIVSCYVTDFPDERLLDNDRIIPIPHLGASTPESEDNCAAMAAEQLRDFIETGNIKNSVNFPNCEMSMNKDYRITIAHKNIPNMVGQITATLASHNINIADMTNRSRDEAVYTMIDLENQVPSDVVNEIAAIPGIIRVRFIAK